MSFVEKIKKQTKLQISEGEPLSKHTSLKIGGPADYFIEPKTQEDVRIIFEIVSNEHIPYFILGGGTNILVGDKGFRGLVIKNGSRSIEFLNESKIRIRRTSEDRHQETHWKEGFIKLSDLDYDEETEAGMIIKVSTGTPLPLLINKTLEKGLTGLQWFARIPGTIGGAVWNNIHGGKKYIGDYLYEVEVIDSSGVKRSLKREELELSYNKTPFQDSKALILSAKFNLQMGDKERAIATFEEWKRRKNNQPYNSAGSTFSNISEEERIKAGIENKAAGFIIDNILDLKGYKVGKVKVSEAHANFLETESGAKAKDALEIIETIQQRTKEKLGIELKLEIVKVGEF